MSGEKRHRHVSTTQFVFIQLYIALTAACFVDFCFATQQFSVYSQYHGFAHMHEAGPVGRTLGTFSASLGWARGRRADAGCLLKHAESPSRRCISRLRLV